MTTDAVTKIEIEEHAKTISQRHDRSSANIFIKSFTSQSGLNLWNNQTQNKSEIQASYAIAKESTYKGADYERLVQRI